MRLAARPAAPPTKQPEPRRQMKIDVYAHIVPPQFLRRVRRLIDERGVGISSPAVRAVA